MKVKTIINQMISYAKETGNEDKIDFLIRFQNRKLTNKNVEASKSKRDKQIEKLYKKKNRRTKFSKDSLNKTQKQKDYAVYLESQTWKDIRDRVFEEKGKVCEGCGQRVRLQVHHSIYSTKILQGESLEGLRVVCDKCHSYIHSLANDQKMKLISATKAVLDDKIDREITKEPINKELASVKNMLKRLRK